MANGDYSSDKDFRAELMDGATSLGRFDFEEIKFGTDGGGVSRDPENGVGLRSGINTGEPFDISRVWIQGRDRAAMNQALGFKNRKLLQLHVWEIDNATDQPLSSDPDTYTVMIREVTRPKGNHNSADESRLVINLEPKAV